MNNKAGDVNKKKIAVIFGGYSVFRQTSIDSSLHIFELLNASDQYLPLPVFLKGTEKGFDLFLLSDPATPPDNPGVLFEKFKENLLQEASETTDGLSINEIFAAKKVHIEQEKRSLDGLKDLVDGVFIALHGRPGIDGMLQKELETRNIPYNGSDAKTSGIAINRYDTLATLTRLDQNILTPQQLLLNKTDYEVNPEAFFERIETRFSYPIMAGTAGSFSAAVRSIPDKEKLKAYTRLIFRPQEESGSEARLVLGISENEDFPRRSEILFESPVQPGTASQFLEISAGLLTSHDAEGLLNYEVFDPWDMQANHALRFAQSDKDHSSILQKVKNELEKAARILNIKAYGTINAFVRVFENNKIETIITDVNTLPDLKKGSTIFEQAAAHDYQALSFVDRILTFAFEEKAFRAESYTPPVQQEAIVAAPDNTRVVPPVVPKNPFASPQVEKFDQKENAMASPSKNFAGSVSKFFKFTFNFLKSSAFLKNIGAIILVALLLLFLINIWLKVYTRHGETLQMPDFTNITLQEAQKKARKRHIDVVILDSVFIEDEAPLQVLKQEPVPLSRVKENRTVYLTITYAQAPMVELPDLAGADDFLQYKKRLRRKKLNLTVIDEVFDAKLEENTILHLLFEGEKITANDLKKGIEVPQGSTLGAVVTIRHTGLVEVPELVCKRYKEASFLITSMNLNFGKIHGEVSDQDNAWVWKQVPAFSAGKMIETGQQVDIYLTEQRPPGCGGEAEEQE